MCRSMVVTPCTWLRTSSAGARPPLAGDTICSASRRKPLTRAPGAGHTCLCKLHQCPAAHPPCVDLQVIGPRGPMTRTVGRTGIQAEMPLRRRAQPSTCFPLLAARCSCERHAHWPPRTLHTTPLQGQRLDGRRRPFRAWPLPASMARQAGDQARGGGGCRPCLPVDGCHPSGGQGGHLPHICRCAARLHAALMLGAHLHVACSAAPRACSR